MHRTLTLVPYRALQRHAAQRMDHGVPEDGVLTGASHGVGWDEPEISETHKCNKRNSDWSHQIPELGTIQLSLGQASDEGNIELT